MSNADDDLPFGLYERLVTTGLKARLVDFDSNTARIVKKELDPPKHMPPWPGTSRMSGADKKKRLHELVAKRALTLAKGRRGLPVREC
ncbi:MAG TPA: hypothetical protein VM818_10690 [Vicinamibacterales bacterium]|jgi:hypothetical protein|nr:hypothetical protein [Vicinamibacterales bacterium]